MYVTSEQRHCACANETPPSVLYTAWCKTVNGGAQDVQDQARAGQEAASEPLHSPVDTNENGQHHQVQLQAKDVAQNEAWSVSRKPPTPVSP